MLGQVLYTWLVVVGLVDALLVAPALGRAAEHPQTTGRLVATLAVLIGMVLVGLGRLGATPITLPPLTAVGMFAVDIGLVGYALYLPERGLLHLRRTRQDR